MAVIDTGVSPFKTPVTVANGNQVVQFANNNTELNTMFCHLIIRGIDAPISFTWYQGNVANMLDLDTNTIIGDDLLAQMADCEGNIFSETITEDGNYLIVLDTFYGKWGETRLDVLGATTGTVRIITNITKKVG